jgi:hypothetical protein
MYSTLFNSYNIENYFAELRQKMCSQIDVVPSEDIMQADVDDLALEFAKKFQVMCPMLGNDISYDQPPFSPGRESEMVTLYVPFTGDEQMFQCHGRTHPVMTENFHIRDNQLVIQLCIEKRNISKLPDHVQAILKRVQDGLQSIQDSLKFLNPHLKESAAAHIRKRQNDIESHKRMLGDLEKSGFTLRRREDGTDKIIVPVKPKVISVQLKPAQGKPAQNPELALSDYDEILNVIQSMAKVYERSPSVFREMEEEHLRTILLVGLNGLFKGNATGETFNGEGKNDILIRVNDNNVFIAECLFWNGATHFKKKITEQLLRYSTWHDSKLAAIVFNRKRNFTTVVQKMREVSAGLDNLVSEMPYTALNSCRLRFHRADDPRKQYILTCLAFEVPS